MTVTRRVKALNSLGLPKIFDDKLDVFVQLFEKWNKSINLSAARDRGEIDLHVIDSLHVVPHLASAKRVLDVGSGGGLPVVIAAICLPDTEFIALEPVHKKHAFLRTAAREVGLANLDALARRIEDHDERDFDVAMSRATFDLEKWMTLALTLVRPEGLAIGFEAIERPDLSMPVERHRYTVDDKARQIVIARRPA